MRSCPDWLQLHCLQRLTPALEYACRRYFRSRFISDLARRPACGSLHEPLKGGCRGGNRQWSGRWVRSCFSQCSLRWWSTPWCAKTRNPVWTTTFWGGADGMGYCWLAHPHKSLYRAFDRAERRRLQSHRCRHGGNYHRTGPGTDSALFLPRYLNRGLTTIIMVQSIYLRLPSRFTWPGKATRSR